MLEKAIMDIGHGICIIEHIEDGYAELHGFIHTRIAEHAYKSAEQNIEKFIALHLQYLVIGYFPVIYSPAVNTGT